MVIRQATIADIESLVTMGRHQVAALFPGWTDNPLQLTALTAQLIESPDGVVFVAADGDRLVGMIGMMTFSHHLTGEKTAGEVAWWVEPDARGIGTALLKHAERWGAEQGALHIQMNAPNTRVGTLYERRGYHMAETTYYRPVTAAMTAIRVVDNVLADAADYAAETRQQTFRDVRTSPDVLFHGIAAPIDDRLARWLAEQYPELTPTLTFVRQSPEGQDEPNFLHTDRDMSSGWTGIYYITPDPPPDDGTTFWRSKVTGAIQSTAATDQEFLDEWVAWRDLSLWEPWHTVPARENRLVLFPVSYFHSRAIANNYGAGDTARLIQVVFCDGNLA
jgi:GNAT superfamily N-acetyltransferase